MDSQGRLVAGATPDYATGQDMTNLEIVRNFVEEGSKVADGGRDREFNLNHGKTTIKMLGTYSPVTNLDWAVVVQKPRAEAYRGVYEMQRNGTASRPDGHRLSIGISVFAARRITNPLAVLTRSSRAIAQR